MPAPPEAVFLVVPQLEEKLRIHFEPGSKGLGMGEGDRSFAFKDPGSNRMIYTQDFAKFTG